MLEKDEIFYFNDECFLASNILKNHLTNTLTMVSPDWSLPFELMYDASDWALGAILGKCRYNHFQHIYYASKTMTSVQEKYTTIEKRVVGCSFRYR